MILGLLLVAMIAALAVSVGLFLLSFPLWLALLAYPVTGTVVLFLGLALCSARRWAPGSKPSIFASVTDRLRAGRRQR